MIRLIVLFLLLFTPPAWAAKYKIDPTHTFVQFKISHLGYSTLVGRFNDVSGTLEWDAEKPEASKVRVKVKTTSVDSNHAKRDDHLRNKDFLNVKKFAEASFRSTEFVANETGGVLKGKLTILGKTQPIVIQVTKIGEGPDPWGGYRVGFEGRTLISRKDFGMDYFLGPKGDEVVLELFVEGIRK